MCGVISVACQEESCGKRVLSIVSSDVFIPVMSKAELAPFATLTPESRCHKVLLEHQLALKLKMRGQLHRIFPVLVGVLRHYEELGEIYGDFLKGNGMPSCPVLLSGSVEATLKEHLQRMGKGARQGQPCACQTAQRGPAKLEVKT